MHHAPCRPESSRSPGALPLQILLQRLGEELAALHAMAAEMEGAVDEMIERHAGTLEDQIIRKLQLLDILTQTLSALSSFSRVAAGLVPPHCEVDGAAATAGLKLASLAHRLAHGGDRPVAAAGDSYELFSDG